MTYPQQQAMPIPDLRGIDAAPWSEWRTFKGFNPDAMLVQVSDLPTIIARALAAQEPLKPTPDDYPSMPELWSVDVFVNGDSVLSIGDNWIGSSDDLDDAVVLGAAKHMLSFIGYGLPDGGFTPPDDDASAPSRDAPGWGKTARESLLTTAAQLIVAYEAAAREPSTLTLNGLAAQGDRLMEEIRRLPVDLVTPSSPSVAAEETKP
jgi:hypothetical protein